MLFKLWKFHSFLKAWGEVDPSLWERLSQNKFAVNKNIYAKIWENLKSVSLDFYDYLIKDEIIKAESQFGLAKIICNIISKNSVSFAFLSMRAEKIISENNFKDFSLKIIEEPKEKQEIYKKVLAKVKK